MFKTIPKLLSGLLFSLTTISTAYALSATTANTIQGTLPYLTFDGGTTKVTTTDGLLGITVTDSGSNSTTYTTSNTSTSPITLPSTISTFEDIDMLVPANTPEVSSTDPTQKIDINDLIQLTSPAYWGDADGDGQGVGGITATGDLQVSITDINGNAVSRTSSLTACQSPYKISLKSSNGYIETAYGAPRKTEFTGATREYYVNPAIAPYACWAKPNLTYNYGTQPEWDGSKGFKLQSLSDASKNFPRTGFHGAFFDITVAGATAADVITNSEDTSGSKTITKGGVTATLKAQATNVVRVMLTGPNHATGGGEFKKSVFEIKSDVSNVIYTFELSKWFIARPSSAGNIAYKTTAVCSATTCVPNYCASLNAGTGSNYRVPSVSEYTNANRTSAGVWSWGLPGWGNNNYARAIGNGAQKSVMVPGIDDGNSSTNPVTSKGGLFAEWGFTANNDTSSPYTSSDFENNDYWSVEPYVGSQHFVRSYDGYVFYDDPSHTHLRAACATP